MTTNCIFICVFNNENYVKMLFLLLDSIWIYGNLTEETEILIYTSTSFMTMIKESPFYRETIKFELNDTYDNIDKACKARLDFFQLHLCTSKTPTKSAVLSDKGNSYHALSQRECEGVKRVYDYHKILYLDTDILIKGDIQSVFDILDGKEVLYVLEEGVVDSNNDYYGKSLFGNEIDQYKGKSAFTSGILLFYNCAKIKGLFETIQTDIKTRPYSFICYDQPYIVYNAFKYQLYDNQRMKAYAVNNDKNINSGKVIHHFPGGPGIYQDKMVTMTQYLENSKRDTFVPIHRIIYDTKKCPPKNTSISIVALCISYQYFDTLQLMLPVNYLHFEKMYIITQEDDIQTVDFCKGFENVEVLFYNFHQNNKKFDKYGAMRYAQEKIYREYPDSWYLNIDSDILLPNRFIELLLKENLHPDCIYGGMRTNVNRTSELLDKPAILETKENKEYIWNDILLWKEKPPSLLGCFQLYKKKIYQPDHFNDAGFGDFLFCHENFDLFCNLENLVYFHLGAGGKNWCGKVENFIHDVNIALNDVYYDCDIKTQNIYYNASCQIVKRDTNPYMNIYDDIWTCSNDFRKDIAEFFSDKPNLSIAEIGSHKGYTTRFLSSVFAKVYAVDNNIEWTQMNKDYNKDKTNIEYVHLDIYSTPWNILPENIDIVFIDADHSYQGCRSDIMNSIKRFPHLQYILFDDYGVWKGVKEIVDICLMEQLLEFERFIGINVVPGPNGIMKYVNEGILCKVCKERSPAYMKYILEKTDIKPIVATEPIKPSSIVHMDRPIINQFQTMNRRYTHLRIENAKRQLSNPFILNEKWRDNHSVTSPIPLKPNINMSSIKPRPLYQMKNLYR